MNNDTCIEKGLYPSSRHWTIITCQKLPASVFLWQATLTLEDLLVSESDVIQIFISFETCCHSNTQALPAAKLVPFRRKFNTLFTWCDVMWCDVMWCDVMWCDIWRDVMWCDMIWYDIWCDVIWCDIWCDVIWYDIWCDVMWCDVMWYMIYLTAIELTPGGSSTVKIYTQTIHRTTQW